MDLGLSGLTDDQLLDLLQHACGELAQRDPYVRSMAQQAIVSEADKLNIAKKELEAAVKACRKRYIGDMAKEVHGEVKRLVSAGFIRVLTVEEEARAILEANNEAMDQLREPTLERIRTKARIAVQGMFDNGLFTPVTAEERDAVSEQAKQDEIVRLMRASRVVIRIQDELVTVQCGSESVDAKLDTRVRGPVDQIIRALRR